MTKSMTLNYTIAVLAAFAIVLAFTGTADAAINSSHIEIKVYNSGKINNTTEADSHTGDNYSEGSFGGRGGEGGDVDANSSGDYNNGGAEAGNGGSGGNASAGGLVNTGNANANAGTNNSLNGTDVDVDLMGQDANSLYVEAKVDNENGCDCNTIKNDTRARARTGENYAEGSFGGVGDDGGDVESGSGDYNNGGAEAGNGGAGGSSGLGGEVKTGVASSTAGTVNLLNTTFVRVRI